MHLGKKLRWLVAAGCASAALAVLPVTANAVTSQYHPNAGVRGLNSGASGWTGSTNFQGLCIPFITCPIITNSAPTSGGNPGGYLRTALSALLGVGAQSRGIWTSPAFTYHGADGIKPDILAFSLSRRADVAAFLGVAGNQAEYTVQLVDQSGPGTITLINQDTLAGALTWTSVPAVLVAPSQLVMGHSYRFRITSQFVNGALVVPGGSADYDNITLNAEKFGVSGNITSQFLAQYLQFSGGIGGRGFLSGNGKSLFVKVRCPKRAGTTCGIHIVAKTRRRGPEVTLPRNLRVKAGQRKFAALRVRPAFRSFVAGTNRLTVCSTIRVRGKTASACRPVKVVKP